MTRPGPGPKIKMGNSPSVPKGRPNVRNKKLPNKNSKKPGADKKKSTASGMSSGGKFGAVGGYAGVNKKHVKKLAKGVIKKEVKGLKQQKKTVKAETKNAVRQANTQYQRGLGDLQHVNQQVTGYLTGMQNQNQQMYQQQMTQQQAAQQALQQSLGNTYSGAQQGINDEMARLGIQGGANSGQLLSDAANAQSQAQLMGAGAQQTMGMASTNAAQLGGLLSGMAQGSHLSNVGKNLNARNDALSEVRQNRTDQLNKVNQAIRDTKGSRGDIYLQLLQQLQQTGWGQYMDQQNLKLARKQANK